MLYPTSGVCVAVGSGPFPLSGACVRCGCGILELMGWFRVGPASSDYSPLYGLVQGGAIYRSMKVRDDGVVVAAKLRLLKVRSANQKTISLNFSGRTSNCQNSSFFTKPKSSDQIRNDAWTPITAAPGGRYTGEFDTFVTGEVMT